jgi:hypothetical protein
MRELQSRTNTLGLQDAALVVHSNGGTMLETAVPIEYFVVLVYFERL